MVWCCKEEYNFDETEFSRVHSRKGYQKLRRVFTIAEEQRTAGHMNIAKFVLKQNKIYFVNLLPKHGKWSQPNKN